MRLQKWVNSVGITNYRLKEPHYIYFNNPKVLLMTKKILNHIKELFPITKYILSKLHYSIYLKRKFCLNIIRLSDNKAKYQKEAPVKLIKTKLS